ncbi:MAG: XdhC family protein [Acidobacteriota bacterium]
MYDEFFAKANELLLSGESFATAIVVRSEKPTSGKPGDKAIVTAGGVMYGWIGGSCAQPAVITEAQAALADGESRLLRITPESADKGVASGVKEVAMTCFSGGTVDVYIEPQEPQPRLVVIGHLPTAQALAHLGKAMSYRVIACDLETEGVAMAHADEVLPDLTQLASRVNPLTYIVIASHGHYDEAALEHALATPAAYIGLVASRKRARPILEELERQGFGPEDLARIKAPAGLDIGARRGDEIALSIMTEIVSRRRTEGAQWQTEAEGNTPSAEAASQDAATAEAPAAASQTAIDPICGMSVSTHDALHTFEHEGMQFYFCCASCRNRFANDPASYLAKEERSCCDQQLA